VNPFKCNNVYSRRRVTLKSPMSNVIGCLWKIKALLTADNTLQQEMLASIHISYDTVMISARLQRILQRPMSTLAACVYGRKERFFTAVKISKVVADITSSSQSRLVGSAASAVTCQRRQQSTRGSMLMIASRAWDQ